MNRLQKKCFIGSAGIHLLLLAIMFVGPAFLSPPPAQDNMPLLDFVPFKTVDEMISGGGHPDAQPPPPADVKPDPAPPAPPPPENNPPPKPEVVKPVVKPPEPAVEPPPSKDPDAVPDLDRKPVKPRINTTLTVRQPDKAAEERKRAADARAREEARQYAQARDRVARALGSATSTIRSGVGASSSLDLRFHGPGGGGVPYANFLQAVKSVYTRAWVLPDGSADDNATVTASVTIARDGTVVSFKIINPSAYPAVNRSVQDLDRVRYAAPLPDDARENQRTVLINFNVKAKRLLG